MAKSMKIRKDDSVVVTGGKDRGKTGRVLRTDPSKRRVYVEGLNMIKRHQRPRSIKDTQKSAQAGERDNTEPDGIRSGSEHQNKCRGSK